jgi:WD40 repeat protein
MTPNSEASEWVQNEIQLAKREHKSVFPMLLEGQPFWDLQHLQYADVRSRTMPDDRSLAILKSLAQGAGQGTAAIRTIEAHHGLVRGLAFSPDGGMLVTGGEEERVVVWNVDTLSKKTAIAQDPKPRWPVSFVPSASHQIVAASYDRPGLHVWDLIDSRFVRTLADDSRYGDQILTVAFSTDGRLLATGDADGAVVWHVDGSRPMLRLTSGPAAPRWPLAFSPDGSRVVVAHRENKTAPVGIWNWAERKLDLTLRGHTEEVGCGAYSADGQLIITGGRDDTARIWDATTGVLRHVLHHAEHLGPGRPRDDRGDVTGAVFTHDGAFAVTACRDGIVRLWRVAGGVKVMDLPNHRGGAYVLAISRDGHWLASGGADGMVHVVDVAKVIAPYL